MKRRLVIPPETVALQARASDPEVSAWVSANAGSGKTHVLAQRVIRLLLGGTDPSKILCLTYTRAAAANMANRVFASLAGWAMLPDDGLASALAEIEGRRPDDRQLKRAPAALRARPGDARWAEDPDHPRLLRGGAPPVPAGGQHRRAFRDFGLGDGDVTHRRGAPRHDQRGGRPA